MRAAVIGAGRMGRRHMQVVRSLDLEIVGISDRSQESLAAAREDAAVPSDRLFVDPRGLMDLRPEVVVIATTAPSHTDYVLLAVESGARFILCEKPMATSLSDCDRLLEACRRSGTRLAVNHQMRFMEQYTLPRDLLTSDDFGGLASVTVVGGNFGMAMNGTHYFEMFRYMTGEAPQSVTAWFDEGTVPNPRGPEFQDRAGAIRVTTASGKRLHLEIGSDQGHGIQAIYAARNGQIVVDELAGFMRFTHRGPADRELPTTRYGMPATVKTREIQPADALTPTRDVLKALIAGADYPTGEEGRLAVATLVAGHVSNDEGHRMVKVDGSLPLERSFPWA